jgi:hypothetical protein
MWPWSGVAATAGREETLEGCEATGAAAPDRRFFLKISRRLFLSSDGVPDWYARARELVGVEVAEVAAMSGAAAGLELLAVSI